MAIPSCTEPKCQAPHPSTSFLSLPFDIRLMIYDLLIPSIIKRQRTHNVSTDCTYYQAAKPPILDLSISNGSATYPSLSSVPPLLWTSRLIHDELFTRIHQKLQIHRVRITGDFLLGLDGEPLVLDFLRRKPWILEEARVLKVNLFCKEVVLRPDEAVAITPDVACRHPWLEEYLSRRDVEVRDGVTGSMADLWSGRSLGLEARRRIGLRRNAAAEQMTAGPCNSLPRLVRLLQGAKNLSEVEIETLDRYPKPPDCYSFTIFPDPVATFTEFEKVFREGAEVYLLMRARQVSEFQRMMGRYKVPVARTRVRGLGLCGERIPFNMNLPRDAQFRHLVRYRLRDCLTKESDRDEALKRRGWPRLL